jgi:peptidoglycan hydrolase-like protein with peptidoglycan-binding domain
MRRRSFLAGIGAFAAVGSVATVVALGGRGDDQRAAAADGRSATTPAPSTVKVATRDLVQTTDFDGTLGFGETSDLFAGAGGTVTAIVPAGTIVDRGGDLIEIDGKTVVLLIGTRPMWRVLGDGVSDGPDVQQLEENLIALGFATADELGPNQTWTWKTTAAVKKWQSERGVEQTGKVDRSQVVFKPAAVRIAQNTVAVGGQAGGPIAKVTAVTKGIKVDLSAKKQSLVKVGDKVQVVLPDGTTKPATIATIGTVATAQSQNGQQGDPTIPVTVTFDDPNSAPNLDQAPVKVRVTTNAARGVLAVPVGALLALSGGGYVVERLTGDGTTEQVPVKLGAFADNYVQVTGNIKVGDEVVVAK